MKPGLCVAPSYAVHEPLCFTLCLLEAFPTSLSPSLSSFRFSIEPPLSPQLLLHPVPHPRYPQPIGVSRQGSPHQVLLGYCYKRIFAITLLDISISSFVDHSRLKQQICWIVSSWDFSYLNTILQSNIHRNGSKEHVIIIRGLAIRPKLQMNCL